MGILVHSTSKSAIDAGATSVTVSAKTYAWLARVVADQAINVVVNGTATANDHRRMRERE